MKKVSNTFRVQSATYKRTVMLDKHKTIEKTIKELLIMKYDLEMEITLDNTLYRRFILYPYKKVFKEICNKHVKTTIQEKFRGRPGALYIDIYLDLITHECTAKIIDFNVSEIVNPEFVKKIWSKTKKILKDHHVDKVYFDKDEFKAPNLMNMKIINNFYKAIVWDRKEGSNDVCRLNIQR